MERKSTGTEKAIQKIRHFCSYQERNHQEVKEKLYSFGLYKEDVEEILSIMIEEGYLNEERYAIAFSGGKFRINKWGRVKIRYELRQKRVSEYCIKRALASIDEQDYAETLQKMFDEKLRLLRSEKNVLVKKRKISAFLVQRGYEAELVSALIKQLQP